MKLCVFESESFCGTDLDLKSRLDFCEARFEKRPPAEKLAEVIGDSDGIFLSKIPITAELMDACPRLKYIGVTATGYNNVDVAAARERGIVVTNIPDYSADAVAQMTFAYILQFATSLIQYTASTAAGDWTRSELFCYFPFPLTELKGKTLGIYGLGSIGGRVAEIGTAFGMKVIYHSRTKKNVPYEWVESEEIFRRSDYLSLHCPLTEETQGLICEKTLSQMKPGAFLINTGRGPLVKEEDLAKALNQGVIAGFGGDVLVQEPQREDCPLRGAKNCYLTPHVAWAPKETRLRLMEILIANLRGYLNGEIQNCVSR